MDSVDPALIKLLLSLDSINTGAKLSAWTSEELQTVFPHGAFVCGLVRIHPSGIAPLKIIGANFPIEYIQKLKQPNGLFFSSVIQGWLLSEEVQLIDSEALSHKGLDPTWLKHFRASGLQNIAAHGVMDYSRQHVSYFSFHQIPGPLGELHRLKLKLLVPHLHTVLLRVLHKNKSRADPHTSRADRNLTTRELEVLTWVCDGKTSAEIATILGIARNTVRNQMQSTLIKLRVNTRSQAVAKAIKKGLVPNRQPDSRLGDF